MFAVCTGTFDNFLACVVRYPRMSIRRLHTYYTCLCVIMDWIHKDTDQATKDTDKDEDYI